MPDDTEAQTVPDDTAQDSGPPETQTVDEDTKKDDQLRTTIADTYTFVRSREINKTIAGFTFDHYIDEAKRSIKEDRILRTAADADKGLGTRPSQLAALQKLQTDFGNAYEDAKKKAATKDAEAQPVKGTPS